MVKKKDLKSKSNIIRVAFALFLEKGYKEVTIKNIMEATNLSKGAIYHHFESKEEIYYATIETYYINLFQTSGFTELTDNFRENIVIVYHFVANLFDSVEKLTKEGMEFPIRNFYSFQLNSENNEIIRKKICSTVIEYRNIIQEIVVNAIENKQIREDIDVEAITLQIVGMLEGISINHSTVKKDIKNVLLEKFKLAFDDYFKMICIN
ncbi:MAG: TetR/AcrR family transcriptional regulator [Flavobacteriaceae bacterium]|nr:TetR/AcrR family transcriptional regulator [Flavobacteriaceae bacterium]